MSQPTTLLSRFSSLTLALGLLGGAVLVLAQRFFLPGKHLLIVVAVLLVAIIGVVRAEKIASFSTRFFVVLGAFTITLFASFVSTLLRTGLPPSPVLGTGWRLGVLVLVGLALSLPATRLAQPPARPSAP